MPSIGTLSSHTVSSGPAVMSVLPALEKLSQSRTADPIVFLELTARENVATEVDEVVEDSTLLPISAGALSARVLPRIVRSRKTYLFSTRPWTGAPDDTVKPNVRAIPRLVTGGRISRSIPVESSANKRGQRVIGNVVLANTDGAYDHLLTQNTLEGGAVKVWIAEPNNAAADWILIYEATVEDVEADRDDIKINITTIADELDRPLQLRQYTGSGGLAGDAAVKGRLKPMVLGEVYGIEPVLISAADWIYAVNDGPILSIDWVSEGGLGFTFTQDYDDFDDLSNATLALGEYATCLSQGLFRIGVAGSGLVYPIRVGCRGDASGGGYSSSTGEILYKLATSRAFLSGNSVDLASFQSLPRSTVGYYFSGGNSVKVSDVFDALLGGVVGYYGVGRGKVLSVGQILPASAQNNAITVREHQIITDRVESRPDQLRLSQPYTYAPTWNPLTPDQISPSADASTAKRLQEATQSGEVLEESELAISPKQNAILTTFFVVDEPAQAAANDALQFASKAQLPVRADIGRRGLEVDIGQAIGIESDRWGQNYRGVVYEQEDDLSVVVNTRVTALGE